MGSATTTDSLNRLLPRCRRGDQEAYAEVVRRAGPALYGTALRLLGRSQEAEEAMQETFLTFFRRVDTVRSDNLGGWLHRVTVNHCLDRLKARGRHPEGELPATLPAAAPAPAGTGIDLARAVSRLPERARLVFLLHDLEGYRHQEVADALGISEGTSKSQLFRARELLRGWLAGGGEVTA